MKFIEASSNFTVAKKASEKSFKAYENGMRGNNSE
jgi:hypothetical protein